MDKFTEALEKYSAARRMMNEVAESVKKNEEESASLLQRLHELQKEGEAEGSDSLKSVGSVVVSVDRTKGAPKQPVTFSLSVEVDPEDSVEAETSKYTTNTYTWTPEEAPAVNESFTFDPIVSREAVFSLKLTKDGNQEAGGQLAIPLSDLVDAQIGAWFYPFGKGKPVEKKEEEEAKAVDAEEGEEEKKIEELDGDEVVGVDDVDDDSNEVREVDEDDDEAEQEVPRVEELEDEKEEDKAAEEAAVEAPQAPEYPALHVGFKYTPSESEKVALKIAKLAKQKIKLITDLKAYQQQVASTGMMLERLQQSAKERQAEAAARQSSGGALLSRQHMAAASQTRSSGFLYTIKSYTSSFIGVLTANRAIPIFAISVFLFHNTTEEHLG